VIGSYNATFTAERYYTENGLAVYDTDAIRAVSRMFDDDFAKCEEVKLKPRTRHNASTVGHTNRPD
jgi:phosphatidylserine/phosphatidylglycerophosphate/cardiolipin synthase-like enzyme